MKKAERIERSQQRNSDIQRYDEEDRIMQDLFCLCKSYLTATEWEDYYESMWQQGKWFNAFNCVMVILGEKQIEIPPDLRKVIDECLVIHGVERDQVVELASLNYDSYWKKQYGYE